MANTTTQSTPWMAPRLENLWNGATQVANRPYQQYQGPRVANMSDITQQALQGYQTGMAGNPTTWNGMGFLDGVIGGQYNNQALDQVANTVTQDASKAFDSKLGQLNEVFSNPNSFGTARHGLGASALSEDFGRGLGTALSNLRYGAFDTDMNRRMNAAGQAQSMTNSTLGNMAQGANLGNIPRNIQQQVYDTGYQDWQNQWNYPMQQSQFLAGMYGLGNGYATRTEQTPDPNHTSQMIGGGLMALGGINSMAGNGWLSSLFGGNGNSSNAGWVADAFGGRPY